MTGELQAFQVLLDLAEAQGWPGKTGTGLVESMLEAAFQHPQGREVARAAGLSWEEGGRMGKAVVVTATPAEPQLWAYEMAALNTRWRKLKPPEPPRPRKRRRV